jgi:hypothetical protein
MYSKILISFLLAGATALFGQTTVSFVYVGESTSPQKITAFAVRSDNTVHTVTGSPFTAPGQSLAASTNFLYATDHQKIAAFKRNASGSLTLIQSFNGVRNGDAEVGSLTLDRTAASLYASEDNGLGDNNYDIYDKLSSGKLSFFSSTGFNVNNGAPLTFNTTNKFAYITACIQATFAVDGFIRASDGILTPFSPNAALPPEGATEDLCPTNIATSALGFAAISYGAANLTGNQNIAIYRIAADGTLHFVSRVTTSFANGANQPMSLQFDPSGVHLAAAGHNGIQLYNLSTAGVLTKVGSPLYTGTNFQALKWDHTSHIYTISHSAVYFFTLKSGRLVQAASPRAVAGARSLITVSLQ